MRSLALLLFSACASVTGAPVFVIRSEPTYAITCEAHRDTDGNGKLHVFAGDHQAQGDRLRAWLHAPAHAVELGEFLGGNERYLAYARDEKIGVLDVQTWTMIELPGARLREPRSIRFLGSTIVYFGDHEPILRRLDTSSETRLEPYRDGVVDAYPAGNSGAVEKQVAATESSYGLHYTGCYPTNANKGEHTWYAVGGEVVSSADTMAFSEELMFAHGVLRDKNGKALGKSRCGGELVALTNVAAYVACKDGGIWELSPTAERRIFEASPTSVYFEFITTSDRLLWFSVGKREIVYDTKTQRLTTLEEGEQAIAAYRGSLLVRRSETLLLNGKPILSSPAVASDLLRFGGIAGRRHSRDIGEYAAVGQRYIIFARHRIDLLTGGIKAVGGRPVLYVNEDGEMLVAAATRDDDGYGPLHWER